MTRRRFGQTRKLPSGRWQARYADPEGRLTPSGSPVRHTAPITFDTRDDAEGWLATERKLINSGDWMPPKVRQQARRQFLTFSEYAESWLAGRRVKRTGQPIADRTRAEYRTMLDKHILPAFGDLPLRYITPDAISGWYDRTLPNRPTYRARTYSLLHAILASATAAGGPLAGKQNPASVDGAGTAERVSQTRPATLDELATIIEAMPDRYRAMVLLGCWCAMRFGELAELRRQDVDLDRGVIRVARAVVRVDSEHRVKGTKSGRGREIAVPPHIIPALADHLDRHVGSRPDALLFPARNGGHMAPSSLYKVWYPARDAAGRPDLRFHDMRHTGAVMAAQTGATLAEIMARLGHSTVAAALRYQHAAQGRDAQIARKLSEMAGETLNR